MNLKKLPRRWALLCLFASPILVLIAIAVPSGRSSKVSAGVEVLAGQSAVVRPSVLLSATNQTSHDYAFSCWLELKTKSGWSDVSPSDEFLRRDVKSGEDIRTLQYFRKGEVVQLEVALPSKEGVYRFHCYYEPLQGTTWSTRTHNWLMTLKLPGKLGACYRQFLGPLAPWPKSFYSKVFQTTGNAQSPSSSRGQ